MLILKHKERGKAMKQLINLVAYVFIGLLVLSLYMNYLAGYWLNVFNLTTLIVTVVVIKNFLQKKVDKITCK